MLIYHPVISSAVHVEKYLDGGLGHFRVLDDVHVLHHQGLASNSDDRFGRHLLGYCLLGVSGFILVERQKKISRTDGEIEIGVLLDRLRKCYDFIFFLSVYLLMNK